MLQTRQQVEKRKMKYVLIIEIREREAYNTQFNIFVNNEEHYCCRASKMQAGWHGLELLM